MALPAVAAVILALPVFSFRHLWDDFAFLERAQRFHLTHLLPDPGTVFYRPISRELYFTVLERIGGWRLPVGHIVNALLLALATWLVALLARRLAGQRESVLVGCAFAALGATPILVGWVSGVQDLLAAVFVLAALHARFSGRNALAVASMAAAVLSKETAIALLPLIAALPWVVGPKSSRRLWSVGPYVALLAAWASIHPGIRIILEHQLTSGSARYVEVGAPGRPAFLLRSALTLFNIPVTGTSTPWPTGRTGCAVAAGLVLSIALLWSGGSRRRSAGSEGAPTTREVVIMALALTALPTLFTALLVGRWVPYYSVIPALGSSILIGIGMSRLPNFAALAAMLAFLVLGVWSRGIEVDSTITTERNLDVTSDALRRVEAGFRSIRPTLPHGAQILLSVAGTGAQSVPIHLHRFQALKVWYDDPSLVINGPERRQPWKGAEILFRVTPALDVIEIDPDTYTYRSSGPTPDRPEVSRSIRSYARGLAASGEVDHAVRVLSVMERADSPSLGLYDRRLAAMVLYDAGRSAEATRLISALPPFSREIALEMVAKVVLERPVDGAVEDSTALLAFGLPPRDADAVRYLLRRADGAQDASLAIHLARRLLELSPGDGEGTSLLRRYSNVAPSERIISEGTP